ncbi:MAG TPA: hypothetical protein VF528_21355 [Pyrinomonadaceae bacterium]|jgi:RNA polymerase subunit RPABC4/transcription elongation factor Spt4
MRCPNCERLVSAFALRCRVCHQRLRFWYILVTLVVVATVAGFVLLLEIY